MSVIVPFTLDEAVAALADHPGALVLAGGTDVMVGVNEGHLRLAHTGAPDVVVAVDRVADLRSWTIDESARRVTIGAGVTWSELLEEPLAGHLPALAEAARTVGSPQIRHAGTLGGNLVTCSPAGDGLPVLAALEAEVHLVSAAGERTLPVAEFMVGVKRTALAPGELVRAVSLPLLDGWQGYAKVGVRNAMVIATASVCLAVDTPTRSIRIALGSVGPTVLRCGEAEAAAAAGVDWAAATVTDDVAREVGALAAAASRPIDDHRSSAAYRRHAVGVLTGRLLRRAFPGTGTDSETAGGTR
jgi:CO/xanthine dehydrogenase FAD-binding subunit